MGSINQGSVHDTLKFLLKNKDGKFASVSGAYTIPALGRSQDQSISCTLRGTDGIRTIAVMEALKESLETGETVKVNDILEKNHMDLS